MTAELVHSFTRALCPVCRRLVDGQRVIRGGRVYLRRHCPEHGRAEALLSGDSGWFLRSLGFVKPGSVPLAHGTAVDEGCPEDCGLCPDHEQHTCLPVIEITNHCNLSCPICLVQNRNDWHMSPEQLRTMLDALVAREGTIETINFSGGEPTLHPRLLEMLDLALARPEISRVSMSTNGVRCASDRELCAELARRGVYVSLQLDGTDAEAVGILRGPGEQASVRRKALENLKRAGARITITATVARGVNDGHLGEIVRLLYEDDDVVSVTFQPAAHVGTGGGCFAHDPLQRMTIPDVVRALAEQTDGLLRESDFLPLPCSHPSCFGLTYVLRTESGWVPFPRFLELDRYLQTIANQGTLRPDDELEGAIRGAIDDLWTGANQVPDAERILRGLRRAILLMYPEDRALALQERLRVGEGLVKTIFIHAFMDPDTFELERVRRCCTHYPLPDGRLVPACVHNNLRRGEVRS